jgi:MoaA/NifB/PqqE/SkfB family radical SAM enzyme
MSESNTICVLPWLHFSVKPNGNIKPCCRFSTYSSEITANSFKKFNLSRFPNASEVLNSQQLSDMRDNMLKGNIISGCEKCYLEERIHGKSMRTKVNAQYNLEELIKKDKTSLKFLEVAFGNYCNLACRSCGSEFSSSWHRDDKIMSLHYERDNVIENLKNSDFIWKEDDFNDIDYIKFTGGEPMLHPNFIKFLDIIIKGDNHSRITLEIFTNCSWIPKDKILKRLQKFKKIKIFLSVDGTGTVNDYIRHNSKWQIVEKTILVWLEFEKRMPGLSVTLTPTVSMYNIFNIKELLIYWATIRNTYNLEISNTSGKVIVNIVTYPEYLAITLLLDYERVITDLNNYVDNTENQYLIEPALIIINFLKSSNSSKYSLEYFLNYTHDLDKLRNQSLKESVPELWQHLENYFKNIGINITDFKGKLNE